MITLTPQLMASLGVFLGGVASLVWAIRRKR